MSYGKHFASMYSGSLFGKPAIVFAVWGYVIANMRPSRRDGECYVELNATLLAATFNTTVEDVQEAIATLEAPDPASRTKTDDGRRLVPLDDIHHAGPQQYRVVNGAHYRAIRDEDARRDYLREAKRKERSRKRVNNVNNVNTGQPPSTQAEAEAEAENLSPAAFAADADVRTAEAEYSEIAQEWGKPKITPSRSKRIALKLLKARDAIRREIPAFTMTEAVRRLRDQSDFFLDWTAWDLEWFAGEKRGRHNAEKVWSFAYRAAQRAKGGARASATVAPAGTRRPAVTEIRGAQ